MDGCTVKPWAAPDAGERRRVGGVQELAVADLDRVAGAARQRRRGRPARRAAKRGRVAGLGAGQGRELEEQGRPAGRPAPPRPAPPPRRARRRRRGSGGSPGRAPRPGPSRRDGKVQSCEAFTRKRKSVRDLRGVEREALRGEGRVEGPVDPGGAQERVARVGGEPVAREDLGGVAPGPDQAGPSREGPRGGAHPDARRKSPGHVHHCRVKSAPASTRGAARRAEEVQLRLVARRPLHLYGART